MLDNNLHQTLADRIKAATPEPRKPNLKQWLTSLDAADRKHAEQLAVDNAWTTQHLLKFLKDENVAVGKDSLQSWRIRHGYDPLG